jgi:hypothetical protein
MISSPITTELAVWYLQNGVFIGYGVTALAAWFLTEAFRREKLRRLLPDRTRHWAASVLLLTVACGFYESFMIVYLVAVFLVFFLLRVYEREEYDRRVSGWLLLGSAAAILSVLLRFVITRFLIWWFHLENSRNVLESRGIHEFLRWFDGSRTWDDFSFVMQEFLVKYYVNGAVYLPILLFVMAVAVILGFAVCLSWKKGDFLILASALGAVGVPWLLPILEGRVTAYRSSQYIPLVCAFAVLLILGEAQKRKVRGLVKGLGVFLMAALLYRQIYETGKWLYLDVRKYEDTKNTLEDLAWVIRSSYDSSKPICIIGAYQTPESLLEETYSPVWSKKTMAVKYVILHFLDDRIWEKYASDEGYFFAETPRLSFLEWGATAFYGFDREIIKLWELLGYRFTEDGNLEHYEEARELMKEGPVWPEKGSVVEKEDHIIVNFGG